MRYFDKTFFKFTLGFLVIIAISLLIMYAASAYAAGVEKIVFTTDSQSIKPNTLSGPITIQTQDSSGNSFQTPETLDLQFISTSPTGEFLGSTGNPATTYMNKNTANRTFYYRDSAEGNFTITVNIKGGDSGIELGANQQIIISSGASQNSSENNSNTSGEVLGASSDSSSSGSASSGGSSTNNVSSLSAQLEVLAGSDRTTSPGSPIWFQATVKKNTTSAGPELSWSFGDGNVGTGPLVSHTYKYPGDYAVVLSAKAGDIFSVSRLKVKVADSDISISDKGEYLEISNNGNAEINLFNWKLENEGKGFIFQPNTIILPRSSIKLDKNLLTMRGLDNSLGTRLKNSLGEEVFAVAPVKEVNISEISQNLENYKNEALVIKSKIQNIKIKNNPSNSSRQENLSQATTSMENIIYEAPKSEGFVARLTSFIKRVFFK